MKRCIYIVLDYIRVMKRDIGVSLVFLGTVIYEVFIEIYSLNLSIRAFKKTVKYRPSSNANK